MRRHVIAFVLTCLPVAASASPDVNHVNAVLGDASYVERFGTLPDDNTPEDLRLRVHLEYVEDVLRAAPTVELSAPQRAARAHNLDLLHAYHARGVFPRNHDVAGRRPHFIDEAGRICAVGYLVEQTAGRALAEAINRDFEWAFVPDIHGAQFTAWVAASGLSVRELAMIQPSYGHMHEERRLGEVEYRTAQVRRTLPGLGTDVQACADQVGLARAVKVAPVIVTMVRGGVRVDIAAGSPAFRACVKNLIVQRTNGMWFHSHDKPVRIAHAYAVEGGSRGKPVDRETVEKYVRFMVGKCIVPDAGDVDPPTTTVRLTIDPTGELLLAKLVAPGDRDIAGERCIAKLLPSHSVPPFAGERVTLTLEIAPIYRGW